eukprot:scaffold34921_cov236-Isochrysis_galbana.AAC.7
MGALWAMSGMGSGTGRERPMMARSLGPAPPTCTPCPRDESLHILVHLDLTVQQTLAGRRHGSSVGKHRIRPAATRQRRRRRLRRTAAGEPSLVLATRKWCLSPMSKSRLK